MEDTNVNYNEILDKFHEESIKKADRYLEKANEYIDSKTEFNKYIKYRNYADGIYDTLATLSLIERKAKRIKEGVKYEN